jgi:hypothetical protein
MKGWKIGAIAGGISGIAGAWLVSEYDLSLLFVIIIGAFIGTLVGIVSKLKKKK